MPNYNIKVDDDRNNLIKELKDYHHQFCTERNRSKSRKYFSIMLEIWEFVSKDLWEQGYWQDYFECGNIVLKCTAIVEGDILNQIGWNHMENENFIKSISYFTQSLKTFETIGYVNGQCESLRYLGVSYHRMKRFGSALNSYQKALTIIEQQKANIDFPQIENNLNEQIQQKAQAAEIHNVLGNLYLKLYNLPVSLKELQLSLDSYCSLGDEYVYYQPAPLLNLGRWYFLQCNYSKAREYYNQCLLISQNINRTDTEVGVLLRLAELANAEGNREEAIKLTEKAKQVAGKEIRKQGHKVACQEEKIKEKNSIKSLERTDWKDLLYAIIDLLFYAPLTFLHFILNALIIILKFKYLPLISQLNFSSHKRFKTK